MENFKIGNLKPRIPVLYALFGTRYKFFPYYHVKSIVYGQKTLILMMLIIIALRCLVDIGSKGSLWRFI